MKLPNPLDVFFEKFRGEVPALDPARELEVEIGCADAQFLFERAAVDPARQYVGLEIREDLVTWVNDKAKKLGAPVTAVWCHAQLHIKTILAIGELGTLRNVARASLVCMMAGADFIKTSTGKESVNAVLPVGLVMVRAIRDYLERTGHLVGFKPAGGIRTAKDSLVWLSLMKEELGPRWLRPELFRFGASALLTDIERQLEYFATGRYSADYRHPMG